MGGLGPGIGGMEYILIAIVALLVLGPERLPGMLHKLGKWVAKARGMANDFRASFDEMARQSELDDLRKEVEALRSGQMLPLGAEADAAFKDIRDEMNKPLDAPAPPSAPAGEWPEPAAVAPSIVESAPPIAKPRARKPAEAKRQPAKSAPARSAKAATPKAAKPAESKPRASRKKAVDL